MQPIGSLDAAKRERGMMVGSQTGHSAARVFGLKDGQGKKIFWRIKKIADPGVDLTAWIIARFSHRGSQQSRNVFCTRFCCPVIDVSVSIL